jgi:hypothetical protein
VGPPPFSFRPTRLLPAQCPGDSDCPGWFASLGELRCRRQSLDSSGSRIFQGLNCSLSGDSQFDWVTSPDMWTHTSGSAAGLTGRRSADLGRCFSQTMGIFRKTVSSIHLGP